MVLLENLNKETIDALLLFLNKAEELRSSSFFNFYINNPNNFRVSSKKLNDQEWIGRCNFPEPHDEFIKAFILSFRFLIQDNEKCSIRNIVNNCLPILNSDFLEKAENISKLRENINQYLDSPPKMEINLTWGDKSVNFSSNREIIYVFIYGHYAHANIEEDKKYWYDFIHLHSDEGINVIKRNFFRFIAIQILMNVTNLILVIANNIRFILDNVVDIHIRKAQEYLNINDIDKAEKNYKNAVYIANRYKSKEFRANLYSELSKIYQDLGKPELAKQYSNRFEEVKDSIRYLERNFWEDEYYRAKFALPIEFEEILKKFLPIMPKFPILVFSLERLYQVQRFEKLIIAKNFSLSELDDSFNLYYEILMETKADQTIWSHQNFTFKKNEEYILRFPFRDDKGVLFITNSPPLFIESYLSWLEIKRIYQNLSYEYGLFQRYIDILIGIELEKEGYKNIYEEIKNARKKKTYSFSIEGQENVDFHFQGLFRILNILINISIYPIIYDLIDLEKKIQLMKDQGIIPFLREHYKGLAWLSLSLTIILYSFLTDDEELINDFYDKKIFELQEICKIIKGRSLTKDFFEVLFNFLDSYIEKY